MVERTQGRGLSVGDSCGLWGALSDRASVQLSVLFPGGCCPLVTAGIASYEGLQCCVHALGLVLTLVRGLMVLFLSGIGVLRLAMLVLNSSLVTSGKLLQSEIQSAHLSNGDRPTLQEDCDGKVI